MWQGAGRPCLLTGDGPEAGQRRAAWVSRALRQDCDVMPEIWDVSGGLVAALVSAEREACTQIFMKR